MIQSLSTVFKLVIRDSPTRTFYEERINRNVKCAILLRLSSTSW